MLMFLKAELGIEVSVFGGYISSDSKVMFQFQEAHRNMIRAVLKVMIFQIPLPGHFYLLTILVCM